MAQKDDLRKEREQSARFKAALIEAFGDAIRRPTSARLGYEDSQGSRFVQVPTDRTGEPEKYYFHEAGGTSFQGEAFLQPGALQSWQIRYGTPIKIRKDPVNGEWEIIGLDTRYAAQFFKGTAQDDGVFVPYNKLAPGMLTQTNPSSMKAQVLSGAYRIGNEWKFVETQETIDWSIAPNNSNVPTNNTKARLALVQLNFTTKALSYKYGDEFPSSLTNEQVFSLDEAGVNHPYLPATDDGHFRCGYIRLVSGMQRITRGAHIWNVQDYLTLSSETNLAEIHKDFTFPDLHDAKIRGGLDASRPATPQGFGDIWWSPDGNAGLGALYITNLAGTAWQEFEPDGSNIDLDDLNDVDAPAPLNNQALVWNSGTNTWQPQTIARFLDDLIDVNATGPTNDQIIAYSTGAAAWTLRNGIFSLNDLTDVDLTVPVPQLGSIIVNNGSGFWFVLLKGATNNQVLTVDSTATYGIKWTNNFLPEYILTDENGDVMLDDDGNVLSINYQD